MSDPQLYFNPRCSKARSARDLLDARGIHYETVAYLEHAPSAADLTDLVAKLDGKPADLVRKDPRFKELGLKAADYVTAEAVVGLLAAYPELIERPVFVVGDRAVIGRPPERVLDLL